MLRMGSGHRLIQQLLHFSLGDAFQRHSLQACKAAVNIGRRVSTFQLESSAAACWLTAACLGLHLGKTMYWKGEQACPFQIGRSQQEKPALFSKAGHNPTRAMP